MKPSKNQQRGYLAFFLPCFILLLIFSLYALFGVFGLSFNQIDLKYPLSHGFTIQNYKNLFLDHRFWNAILISFKWLLVTTSGSILIGLGIALFLFRRFRRVENIISVIFIIPAILSRVGVAQAWRLLYRSFGIFNYFSNLVGLGSINFLADPRLAFFSVAFVDIWQWCPLIAFLFLSLLNSIPESHIEEAMIEGANRREIHWFITLPMISNGALAIFFIKFVESLRTFDLIYILTQGGPGSTTETLDLFAFYQGVTIGGKISYAASMSVIMLILSLTVLTFLWRSLWKKLNNA